MPRNTPRVVVAHDYLTQRGGAERVVLSLLKAFPGAPLVTGMYEPDATFPEFAGHEIHTLPLNRFAPFRKDPRLALPVLPAAFSRARVERLTGPYDVLVASSSGWAHGLRSSAPKLVYCHTPARWLYETEDYFGALPAPAAAALRGLALPALRRWDRRAAASVQRYLVNSTVVRDRVARAYGVDPTVVHPPVAIDVDGPQTPVPGLEPGFLLTVSRKRGYKNTDVICSAVEQLPGERLVVVGNLPEDGPGGAGGPGWSDRLRALQNVPDAQMRWLYANAAALVAVSREDFGLTPIEAYSFGTPGVVLRAGGYLDSSVEGVTGVFVEEATPESLGDALRTFRARSFDRRQIQAHAGSFGETAFCDRIRNEVATLLDGAEPVPVEVPDQSGPAADQRPAAA